MLARFLAAPFLSICSLLFSLVKEMPDYRLKEKKYL